MRLGQLARQLDITTDKIVNFLSARDIAIDNSANARIDDTWVDLIVSHFAPDNETLRRQLHEQVEPMETEPGAPETTEPQAEVIPDLIRAPKVELPGLRVVGKIELPEKKKPEPPKETGNSEEPRPVMRNPRRNQPARERKNPIAQAREREEEEKKMRREEERQREKERKAAYYQKRLKPQAPTKAVRLFRDEVEEMPAMEPERPRTLWGRFMRWLNH